MRQTLERARLFIDDQHVGDVLVRGWESSWGFGDFTPNERFGQFAMVFGRWSLLMHATDDQRTLPNEASDELRGAEAALDRLRARLFLCKSQEWRNVGQLNIDGKLIEWKER
jgi:hypothetical protein